MFAHTRLSSMLSAFLDCLPPPPIKTVLVEMSAFITGHLWTGPQTVSRNRLGLQELSGSWKERSLWSCLPSVGSSGG